MVLLVVYIAMGWICVLAFPSDRTGTSEKRISLAADRRTHLIRLEAFIYALKLPIFNATHKNFGSHEIFHLFVMGGSLCHYVMMYAFVA